MGKLDFSTGEKNTLAEYFKVVKSERDTFQDFNLIVEAFTQTIGFFIFPDVLYLATPVLDGTGGRMDFFYFRRSVYLNPFREFFKRYYSQLI